jgi:hypothetical protein
MNMTNSGLYVCSLLATAMLFGAPSSLFAQAQSAQTNASDGVPTPHTSDGHPDLNGIWVSGRGAGGPGLIAEVSPDGKKRDVYFSSVSPNPEENRKAGRVQSASRPKDPNQPVYKPDLVAKVQQLASDPDHNDPSFTCQPAGLPRMGAPNQIVQTPGQVVFLYATNPFRVIPLDGRPHRKDLDPSYMGDSVGHWEGDTLVIDVTGFNDETWLAPGGYFHSEALHVTERLTRQGDTVRYQATLEDPDVLTKPWVMNPKMLKLGGADDALVEDVPCKDLDQSHMPRGVN